MVENSKKTNNQHTGKRGENIACEWLLENGYSIVATNWRHSHWEIDIIASKAKVLHFVEVKTRTGSLGGLPEQKVGNNKIALLKNAAEAYLNQHAQWMFIQFDIIAIVLNAEKNAVDIKHIEDIF